MGEFGGNGLIAVEGLLTAGQDVEVGGIGPGRLEVRLGGNVRATNQVIVNSTGRLDGEGIVDAAQTTNSGVVAPGSSAGTKGGTFSGNGTIGGALVSPGNGAGVASAVPEPSAMILAIFGLVGLFLTRPSCPTIQF